MKKTLLLVAVTLQLLSVPASAVVPVNGACGISHGQPSLASPGADLCSAGTATAVAGSGPWQWSCLGTDGGATESCYAPLDADSVWGGIWHKTNPDGSLVDCLNMGVNTYLHDFTGLTLSVSGPNGFSYTFSDADSYVDAYGEQERYKEFSEPLPMGLYTFTLNDGKGHVSKRSDVHVDADALPPVDSSSIRYQRNPDGSYLFAWAPVQSRRTLYYRLVITLDDAAKTALFYSSRSHSSNAYVPAEVMQDGRSYSARVEVHDAASYEAVTNRAYSSFVQLTPQPSDYHPDRLAVDYAVVYNRYESNGAWYTDLSLGLNTLNGITSASVTGPGGFQYQFQPSDLDSSYAEIYKKFDSTLPAGRYRFQVTANGLEHVAYATLTEPTGYPLPDAATYQAAELGDSNQTIRFSWADVNHNGALYYRVYVHDTVTGESLVSPRVNKTFVEMEGSYLGSLANKRWRVEVCDSSSITTQRNRIIGAFKPLAPQPYDPLRPVIYANFSHANNFNGADATSIWMVAFGDPGTAAEMQLAGPNGYSRDITSTLGSIDFLEPVRPEPGLYTFTAADRSGSMTRLYNYQPEPFTFPAVDFRTVHVNTDASGYLNLTWAPVASELPLWYGVEFYSVADSNGDGLMDPVYLGTEFYHTNPSAWFHVSQLPSSPFMFRIFAFDGSDGSTYNNYSRSVMIGYSGAGFDYASLTDADGDGYASNVDADDAVAEINPFPQPVIKAFSLPVSSTALTVPVGTLTAAGDVTGWCLSEINHSATCAWSGTKPASYTFQAPGPHTLYAFVRGRGGNISASVAAQTTITQPVTFPMSLALSGAGAGTVTGSMTCSKGVSCPGATFPGGSTVTLTASSGHDSIFSGWSGDCAGSTGTCTIVMNGPKSIGAAFAILPPVWLGSGSSAASYFPSLGDAYQAAAADATIRAKAQLFSQVLTLDRDISITLKGGYNAGYLSNAGNRSLLQGSINIRRGKLVAEGLAIR